MPITTTFFPALLQACDDEPNETQDIQLTCGICHEQMTLEDEADPHLRAFVLSCMHIYCKGCVDAMVAHYKNDPESHYACPTCRVCLHCGTCRAPSEKGHLIHRDGEKSIALIEDILKLWQNVWHCLSCDMEIHTSWLQVLLKVSRDCTETVDNGQLLSIFVEYQGKTWGEPPRNVDCRLVEQQPLPPHLEIPVKIIEKGLLRAHGLAVPDDGSTVLRYDLRLYELRDREHKVLVRERRYIEQTEQEMMRRWWAGNRKLTVLDLAFDLRDYWSDCNVRQKLNELGKRIMRDKDVDEDEDEDM